MNEAHSAAAARYPDLRLFIDGTWIGADGRASQPVIDPSTGDALGHLPLASALDIDRAIDTAEAAFRHWRETPALDRSDMLRAVAGYLRARREEWAELIALELGKPLAEALREADVACEMFEWGAEEARRLYGRIIPARASKLRVMAIAEPVGPVAAICGWNAPAVTPARKISAALAAGCTIVVKPSEATPASALMISRACAAADVPPGVVNMIFGDPPTIGRRFASDPAFRALTFTGGTEVGKQLASLAASGLKRTVFELGGHAPVLVFNDVDIDAVARACVAAKFRNAGQICTSPTRIIVQKNCLERFSEAAVAALADWRVGDPFEPGIRMGPLQNGRRRDAVAHLVSDALGAGGRLLAGGKVADGPGFFHQPTLLADVSDSALIRREEPFGPLGIVMPFEDVDDALAQANALPFGLAAYAFTHDLDVSERLTRDMEAGTLAINHWAASFPETPFGGLKDSGLGSEGGTEGVAAFVRTRLVTVGSR